MDITVVGVGYVGTVAAANLAATSNHVLGVDIDRDRIELLRSGIVPFHEPGLPEMIQSSLAGGCLRFKHLIETANQAQAIVLMTEWNQFISTDWGDIAHCMNPPRFVYDGRNAPDLIGVHGSGQCPIATVASSEAVSGQYAELDLRHPFGKLRTGLSQLAGLGA